MTDCRHPERPAAARCVVCGRTLCEECRRKHCRRNYCPACWPRRKKARFRSPTAAFIGSVIPGLGHIYAGSWLRGIFFPVAIFSCLASHCLFLAPLVIFLLLFCAWDARMAALKRNQREADRLVADGVAEYGEVKAKRGGAGESDWMLWGAAATLAFLFLWLPVGPGIVVAPWMIWGAFGVAVAGALLLGNGGAKDRADLKAAPAAGKGGK